jgi:hypothetical protein
MGKQAQKPPELYRIILPVMDIKKASIFYSKLLDLKGRSNDPYSDHPHDSTIPESSHRRKTSTLSFGHAPSHGMVPLSSRLRISGACVRTSL